MHLNKHFMGQCNSSLFQVTGTSKSNDVSVCVCLCVCICVLVSECVSGLVDCIARKNPMNPYCIVSGGRLKGWQLERRKSSLQRNGAVDQVVVRTLARALICASGSSAVCLLLVFLNTTNINNSRSQLHCAMSVFKTFQLLLLYCKKCLYPKGCSS